MRLCELLEGVVAVPPGLDPEVGGLAVDSRRVRPGDVFFAAPGMSADGRTFIREAVARGAAAVVYEAADGFRPGALGADVPLLGVAGLRARLGTIADRFYGSPSRRLTVIGVTGTNGKTTCSQILAQALDNNAQGARRCAVIGTLGYGFPGALDPSLHTTPDGITLHRLFAEFLAQGAAYVSMEVSSHALDQGRVNAVAFDVAVFTNLTREHLDYHGDMETYGNVKAALFVFPGLKYAVINADDAFGRTLIERVRGRLAVLSYGLAGGEVRALALHPQPEGLVLQVATPLGKAEIASALLGRFNAYNLLAALATLLALGMDLAEAVTRLGQVRPVTGRAERFGGGRHPLVIVDYAHTPDALAQVLQALRAHARGRLWCVFGCGGERDRGKRPEMGRIAETLADEVILTDDNPRREDPERIIADILAGMHTAPRVLRDRRAAIAHAITSAAPGDVVLVAGKGHEDYQQLGEERRPYSDRDTVRELLGETEAGP